MVTVRWIDATTGEDFTARMNGPSISPGEDLLTVAGVLGRLMVARQIEAERQLLQAVSAELQARVEDRPAPRTVEAGDELTLNGVSYKYDGSTEDGEHFTRLNAENWEEALVSLRRGSAAADWMLRRLRPQQ